MEHPNLQSHIAIFWNAMINPPPPITPEKLKKLADAFEKEGYDSQAARLRERADELVTVTYNKG